MKKALISVSLALASFALVSAQVIQVGGTIGGVPVVVGNQNGGTVLIGQSAVQGQVNGGSLISLLNLAQAIVSRLIPFTIGLAVLAFFWFLIEFIWKGRADPEAKTTSLKGMGYAIIALFVMVSIWGLVGFLGSIVGIGQGGSVPIPSVPAPCPTNLPC